MRTENRILSRRLSSAFNSKKECSVFWGVGITCTLIRPKLVTNHQATNKMIHPDNCSGEKYLPTFLLRIELMALLLALLVWLINSFLEVKKKRVPARFTFFIIVCLPY